LKRRKKTSGTKGILGRSNQGERAVKTGLNQIKKKQNSDQRGGKKKLCKVHKHLSRRGGRTPTSEGGKKTKESLFLSGGGGKSSVKIKIDKQIYKNAHYRTGPEKKRK